MINLRDFPLGKGVLNADGKLRANSYGRGVITKYALHGYIGADPDVLLEDDFSNRDYLNGWLPGNIAANYGLGRLQSEWVYRFEQDLGDVWESWDVSNHRFYLPRNNKTGMFFANPQEKFLFELGRIPTSLDDNPTVHGFPSGTPQYDPTGTNIDIDEDNRHFRLDLEIGWSASTSDTLVLTPYLTALSTLSLVVASGTATLGGVLAMSTGNTSYSSPVKLSFVWQTRGYENELDPSFYYNQLAVFVNDNEVTRSHCRVGTLLSVGQQGAHSTPVVVNFKRLLADLTTYEETEGGVLDASRAYLLRANASGTNPSPFYVERVTLSRVSIEDVFPDCCIFGIGAPQVTIQNATPTLANGTYNQEVGGVARFANSSTWSYVGDSSFPLAIGSMVIGGGVGIPRAVSITGIFVRINEYAQPIVRVNFSVSGGSPITADYMIAGVYPNYYFPVTMTKAKTSSGSWGGWQPLGDNVEFVVEFL